jgi:hypothetical protein
MRLAHGSWFVALVVLAVGCTGVDKPKVDVYLGAMEAEAQHATQAADVLCTRAKDPERAPAVAAELQSRASELKTATEAAFQALLATTPPRSARDRLAPPQKSLAKLQEASARVAQSCGAGKATAETPKSRADLDGAARELKEMVAMARMGI